MRLRTGGLMLAVGLSCAWAVLPAEGDAIHRDERPGWQIREFRDELRRSLRDARDDARRDRQVIMRSREEAGRHAQAFRKQMHEMRDQLRAQMRQMRDQIRESARQMRHDLREQHRHHRGWI